LGDVREAVLHKKSPALGHGAAKGDGGFALGATTTHRNPETGRECGA
jgi:hypothetical protein